MRWSESTLEKTGKIKTKVFRFRLCFHWLALKKTCKSTRATLTRLLRLKGTSSCLSKSETTRKTQAKNFTNSKKTCSCLNFTKPIARRRLLNNSNSPPDKQIFHKIRLRLAVEPTNQFRVAIKGSRITQKSTKIMRWRLFWSWTRTLSMHWRTHWSRFSGCTAARVHPSTFHRTLMNRI